MKKNLLSSLLRMGCDNVEIYDWSCIYLLTCKDYSKQRDQNPKIPSDSYLQNCAINTHTKFQKTLTQGNIQVEVLKNLTRSSAHWYSPRALALMINILVLKLSLSFFFRNFVHLPLYRQKPSLAQSYRYCSLADWIMKLALIFYDISQKIPAMRHQRWVEIQGRRSSCNYKKVFKKANFK